MVAAAAAAVTGVAGGFVDAPRVGNASDTDDNQGTARFPPLRLLSNGRGGSSSSISIQRLQVASSRRDLCMIQIENRQRRHDTNEDYGCRERRRREADHGTVNRRGGCSAMTDMGTQEKLCPRLRMRRGERERWMGCGGEADWTVVCQCWKPVKLRPDSWTSWFASCDLARR